MEFDNFDFSSCSDAMDSCASVFSIRAHTDVIISAYCAKGPPILVTLSNDGYQRVWAPTGELLGEISLPSVDKQRKLERWASLKLR